MGEKNFIISTTRLENFSDGVFAIILTLLAFQFKVPKFSPAFSFERNFRELLLISPYLLGFLFSFIFVAVFWVNHHHLYHTIREVNGKLLWYNIHSLFWIAMIPFAIAMVGDHPDIPLVAISLGVVLFMASLAAYLLRRYSYLKSKLVDETLSYESIRDGLVKNTVALILTAIGILTAIKYVYVSYIIYFAVLAVFMIPQKMEKIYRRGNRNRSSEAGPG
ncbi:MAG: TMEM175 family protein [Ferruginibacter sp.]